MAIAKHISEDRLDDLRASTFWDSVEVRAADCWPWTGAVNEKVYACGLKLPFVGLIVVTR